LEMLTLNSSLIGGEVLKLERARLTALSQRKKGIIPSGILFEA